ncbi:MAG: SCP2 sterol-binding domain-containing protein [Pseudonocardiaceae bacterium]
MVAGATQAAWQQGQDALRDEVQRVTALLRSIQDPGAPAVGQWNLGEVAMHLSQVWIGLPSLARQDLSPVHEVLPSTAAVAGGAFMRDLWDLADLMTLAVHNDPERDLRVLADRIEARAQTYFSECVEADPDEPRAWMVEGTTVRQSVLTYHLLNETLLHGYDIARAARRPWRVDPAHAAMALGRFVVPTIRMAGPRVFVNEAKAAGVRATYDLRIRGGDSFFFIFDDGTLTIEDPSSRKVDCRISAEPGAFLLVSFARQSQWTAIAKGKLVAWGRKPWLGTQLSALVRNP